MVTLRANSASRNHSEGRGTGISGDPIGVIKAPSSPSTPWWSTHGRDEEAESGDGYPDQHSFLVLVVMYDCFDQRTMECGLGEAYCTVAENG